MVVASLDDEPCAHACHYADFHRFSPTLLARGGVAVVEVTGAESTRLFSLASLCKRDGCALSPRWFRVGRKIGSRKNFVFSCHFSYAFFQKCGQISPAFDAIFSNRFTTFRSLAFGPQNLSVSAFFGLWFSLGNLGFLTKIQTKLAPIFQNRQPGFHFISSSCLKPRLTFVCVCSSCSSKSSNTLPCKSADARRSPSAFQTISEFNVYTFDVPVRKTSM